MAYTDVLYERKNQIAWLTINRPDKGNSFRRQTILELLLALNEARHDPEVRVVVLSGAGDRFFCIGGEKEPNDGMLHYHNVPPVVDLYTLIDMMPVPVIAMVNGFAVGGGNVLANMCDLTVASEQATFRQVGPMMGSYDAGFGTWYLEDSVGRKRAREIWYLNPGARRPEGGLPCAAQRGRRHEPHEHRSPGRELLPHGRGQRAGTLVQRERGSQRGKVLSMKMGGGLGE